METRHWKILWNSFHNDQRLILRYIVLEKLTHIFIQNELKKLFMMENAMISSMLASAFIFSSF